MQAQGSDLRWMGAISGGGERSLVELRDVRWRAAVSLACGEERSLVKECGLRRRGAVLGGGVLCQVKLAISGGGERSQVERIDLRWICSV